MKIDKDIKKQIIADKDHLSINQISKKYSLPRNEIKKVIQASEKKTPKFFYAVLILFPLLILVLIEIALRIFNYGYDTRQWVDAGEGKYVINPNIGKKYFNDVHFAPRTIEDVFDQQKRKNSFRVFVLGGSSAEGYPFTPLGSFSKYIRKRLELTYPGTHIEVVNISMTAVGTYTLLDLMPGVLDQKPDLILLYTGHNEYYGALGVGSMESMGTSRTLIRLILYLDKFKVTQLVRNTMSWFSSLFSSKHDEGTSSTLMSRMIKDQSIPLNSDTFNAGVEQFRDNLKTILSMIKEKGVTVIVGKLVSNLKDQKPFISVYTPNYGTADQVYKRARTDLADKNYHSADSLFKLAKDLDALRFRAPEKMNVVIDNLCSEFNVKTVPIDSMFDADSPDGIVGNNLIVDHLHPNISGYELMGKAFYDVMSRSGDLPKNERPAIPFEKQDSVTRANFMFTRLDSVIGNNVVTLLKNDWPFTAKKRTTRITESLFKQKNFLDSIALEYMENKITWADAHLRAATEYLRKDNIDEYLKYMNVLIYQYPSLKNLNSAIRYFYERNEIDPRDYTMKRIGIISLYNKNYKEAINNLSEYYKSNPSDTKVLFSLAESYYRVKDFDKALNLINECLKIDPAYPFGGKLRREIQDSINSR